MSIRATADRRRGRQVTPYETNSARQPLLNREEDHHAPRLNSRRRHESSIKFLLSNILAGVLIGAGGALVREMMEISQAEVHISDARDPHPNTASRTIYITGSEAAVNLAQSLVWEMIGQQTSAQGEGKRSVAWHPAVAKANPGEYDDVQVEGKITIPAHSSGMIIGKGGSGLRALEEESQVEITVEKINANDEGNDVTLERIITLKGTAAGCMNCTYIILTKLATLSDEYYYSYNGTSYTGAGKSRPGRPYAVNYDGYDPRINHRTASTANEGGYRETQTTHDESYFNNNHNHPTNSNNNNNEGYHHNHHGREVQRTSYEGDSDRGGGGGGYAGRGNGSNQNSNNNNYEDGYYSSRGGGAGGGGGAGRSVYDYDPIGFAIPAEMVRAHNHRSRRARSSHRSDRWRCRCKVNGD